MTKAILKNPVLDSLINELEHFDIFEQEQLLVQIKIKKYLNPKIGIKASKKITNVKQPTLQDINTWKHLSKK